MATDNGLPLFAAGVSLGEAGRCCVEHAVVAHSRLNAMVRVLRRSVNVLFCVGDIFLKVALRRCNCLNYILFRICSGYIIVKRR